MKASSGLEQGQGSEAEVLKNAEFRINHFNDGKKEEYN